MTENIESEDKTCKYLDNCWGSFEDCGILFEHICTTPRHKSCRAYLNDNERVFQTASQGARQTC